MKQKRENVKIKKEGSNIYGRFFLVIIFSCAIFALIPLVTFSFLRKINYDICENNISSKDEIRLLLDKEFYKGDEEISVSVLNDSDQVIYLESCDNLGVFEKKIDEEWVILQEDNYVERIEYYEGFDKKDSNVDCQLEIPDNGAGLYRLVVPIFYNCSKANRYACESSRIFYSESFEVLEGSDDLCFDYEIDNCDQKMTLFYGYLGKEDGAYYLKDIKDLAISKGIRLNISNYSDFDSSMTGERVAVYGLYKKNIEVCAEFGNCIENYDYPNMIVEKIFLQT